MLPPRHRLPGYRIPELLKRSKRSVTGNYSLYFEEKPGDSRIGIIVPVRLAKKPAHRNRTKRLIMEACFQLMPSIPPGFDILIIAQRLLKDEKLADVLPFVKVALSTIH